jgi:hypothetical protein
MFVLCGVKKPAEPTPRWMKKLFYEDTETGAETFLAEKMKRTCQLG